MIDLARMRQSQTAACRNLALASAALSALSLFLLPDVGCGRVGRLVAWQARQRSEVTFSNAGFVGLSRIHLTSSKGFDYSDYRH